MLALFITVTVGVLFQRLIELRIAKRNFTAMLAGGGEEYGAGHYPAIVALHLTWYLGWIFESLVTGLQLSHWWPLWLVLLLSAEILRYWSMHVLGPYWCMRIVAMPSAPWIRHGPYRFMAHPNYVAVTIELAVIPMLFNAWRTALAASVLYLFMLFAYRLPAERRAMNANGIS